MGVRIAQYLGTGYEPIGYFQMWNPKVSGVSLYPDHHGACDRTDVIHAKKFERGQRHLLPELICIHLESEALDLKEMGKNWNGRKTKVFGPDENLSTQEVQPPIVTSRYQLPWYQRVWNWIKMKWNSLFN